MGSAGASGSICDGRHVERELRRGLRQQKARDAAYGDAERGAEGQLIQGVYSPGCKRCGVAADLQRERGRRMDAEWNGQRAGVRTNSFPGPSSSPCRYSPERRNG